MHQDCIQHLQDIPIKVAARAPSNAANQLFLCGDRVGIVPESGLSKVPRKALNTHADHLIKQNETSMLELFFFGGNLNRISW